MTTNEQQATLLEWQTLQNQYDSYEKYSLIIRLLSILIVSFLMFHQHHDYMVGALCVVLWGQDAIWKTFQSRIYTRLLVIEKAVSEQQFYKGMQFNTHWESARGGIITMLGEYLKHAFTPTLLAIHVPLITLAIGSQFTAYLFR